MANDFFAFKQFTIFQKDLGMKVATDSCLFGALCAHHLHSRKKVLDIGCGTGLLSLMHAQKHKTVIHGIDIAPQAIIQARENLKTAAFEAQITFECVDFLDLSASTIYDLIFCNPPFFENGLFSSDSNRDWARNNIHLSYSSLFSKVKSHFISNQKVYFALLIPFSYKKKVLELAKITDFFLTHDFTIFPKMNAPAFRLVLFFSLSNASFLADEIFICDKNNTYTSGFKELLRDYYLYL